VPGIPIRTEVHSYPPERAGDALEDLRRGRFMGAAVVSPLIRYTLVAVPMADAATPNRG
jgi:hypothetical protein